MHEGLLCQTRAVQDVARISETRIFELYIYQLYQLSAGGRTQKAKPVQGVYLKSRSLSVRDASCAVV